MAKKRREQKKNKFNVIFANLKNSEVIYDVYSAGVNNAVVFLDIIQMQEKGIRVKMFHFRK